MGNLDETPPPFIDAGPLPAEACDDGTEADQSPTVDTDPDADTTEAAPVEDE